MNQIIRDVVSYNDISTWYSLCFVSHQISGIAMQDDSRESQANHLWILIRKFPNKPWIWKYVLSNSFTTWEQIHNNPDKFADMDIADNPNISSESLRSGKLRFRDGTPAKYKLSTLLSRDDYTMDMFQEDVHLIQDNKLSALSGNVNLTIDVLIMYKHWDWDWVLVSMNRGIKFTDIIKYVDYLPWNWLNMSYRRDLFDHFEFVISTKHRWYWKAISENAPIHIVKQYSDLMNPEGLINNMNITHRVLLQFTESDHICGIPVNLLKLDGLYDQDKLIGDYKSICLHKLRNKYKRYAHNYCDLCKQCMTCVSISSDPINISHNISSYKSVICNPHFDWRWDILSRCSFNKDGITLSSYLGLYGNIYYTFVSN